ncbi:MAG: hypothetical protein NXH84_13505, partial [Rhodobacteraceae bacterium]|nr:hypothetical protein [Paracoccaceae bacterium]
MKLFGRKSGSAEPSVWDFFYDGQDVAADIREKYDYDGDLLRIFAGMSDVMVHKWHHYIPLYER